MRSALVVALMLSAVCWLGTSAGAQTLYGSDATSALLYEFSTAPGGACPAPNPFATPCQLGSFCPGLPAPSPTAGTIFGDVATNKLRDTVFVTDGRTIHEYTGDSACNIPAACTWINGTTAPTFMGDLTGMGMDSAGGTYTPLGTPVLWVTDGALIAGLIPSAPGSCAPFGTAVGPFAHGVFAAATLTDITWDPNAGTLWACDTQGQVHNINVGGGPAVGGTVLVSPGSCGLLGAPLTGISLDTSTPCTITGAPKAYYVTDGFVVDYLDTTGAAAVPTFYTPVNCTNIPVFLNGLAHTGHSINFGTNRVTAGIGTFGQSVTPSPGFGLELTNAPPASNIWLVVNSNVPGPGYACPSIPGVGTKFWVNPTGWTPFFLGTVTSSCMTYTTGLPASMPACIEIYCQFVLMDSTNTFAFDATEGMEFAIQLP